MDRGRGGRGAGSRARAAFASDNISGNLLGHQLCERQKLLNLVLVPKLTYIEQVEGKTVSRRASKDERSEQVATALNNAVADRAEGIVLKVLTSPYVRGEGGCSCTTMSKGLSQSYLPCVSTEVYTHPCLCCR